MMVDEGKSLQEQLDKTQQDLKRAERQLEKTQSYNEELRQQIELLSAELHTYRNAGQQQKQDKACQMDEKNLSEAYADRPFPDWGIHGESVQDSEKQAEDCGSIADSLKAAAQEMVWKEAGFVFDSISGLYYNSDSGYYYDAERSLYYDPSTASYFYYDETEQSYKFYSYASGQNNHLQSEKQESTETDALQSSPKAPAKLENIEKNRREKNWHKTREKAKVQKCKISKCRRRIKKTSKLKASGKLDEKGAAMKKKRRTVVENKVMVVEDSDEAENSEQKDNRSPEVVHAMEVESSDSLVTGESEIESDPESGELTDQSSFSSDSAKGNGVMADPVEYDQMTAAISESEISSRYPPCIRVIVQGSDVVDVGTLFLVTCTGGTIGRDKDPGHSIQIKDINVSKVHAEIRYDKDNSCYTVKDLGSQNGTFLNDLRISESKESSSAIPLSHEDKLQVGGTTMLLHIHPGNDTCDGCEPGQVKAALQAEQLHCSEHVVFSKEEKKRQARQQLKTIKHKYGLANSAYVDNIAALKNPLYADKAYLRRRFVGSEHPSHQKRNEATASVHRAITSENKGHRMLAKMGWKEGSGLGKDSKGRADPVTVELRANQKAGLGSSLSTGISLDSVESAVKTRRIYQTQARYQLLEKPDSPRGDFAASKTSTEVRSDGLEDDVQNDKRASKQTGSSNTHIQWIQGETQKLP